MKVSARYINENGGKSQFAVQDGVLLWRGSDDIWRVLYKGNDVQEQYERQIMACERHCKILN